MKINYSPKITSNNYGINYYDIDDELINVKINKFDSYNYKNLKIKSIEPNTDIKYGMGNTLNNQIKNDYNFSYDLIIEDDGIIEFVLDDNNPLLVDYINLVVKHNKNINLIIIYKSNDDGKYYHNGLIRTLLNDNSSLNITVINMLNDSSVNIMSIDNVLTCNAKLDFNIIDLGGVKSISNYYTNLNGDNNINNLNSIFLGNKFEEFDINYITECFGKNSNVNIEVEGALNDEAKKHFKGTIDFKRGSKKSVGNEKEYTILLSKDAKSKSLPMILSSEEDCLGNHSSACGKAPSDLIFYMNSRGISKSDALRLLVRSRFNNTINKINNDEVKMVIEKIIDRKMMDDTNE